LAVVTSTSRWTPPPPQTVSAHILDLATGQAVALPQNHGRVGYPTFSPDGTLLLTLNDQGAIQIWDVASSREVERLPDHGPVDLLTWSPTGRFLGTAGAGTAYVWEWHNRREVARMQHEDRVSVIAFSPDEDYLATISGTYMRESRDTSAHVWEVASSREVARVTHDGQVYDVAFSPDGKYLATASADRTTRLWHWRSKDLIAEACSRLPRNLTPEEWRQYLGDEPPRKTCPGLP
jgi:WD40 repeat protein